MIDPKSETQKPTMYSLIASLVTKHQMDYAQDLGLGPMSKKNTRIINKLIGQHNESMKTLAIDLKNTYESIKSKPLNHEQS